MGSADTGLEVLGCVQKQSEQATECKPVGTAALGLCFSACFQVPA